MGTRDKASISSGLPVTGKMELESHPDVMRVFVPKCGYRPLRGSVKEREFKKFVIYSCYAWGCSLLFLVVCLVIDFTPGVPDHILKPEFGTIKCWLATRKGQLVYFYIPIGVLVITNVLFFALTAVKIIQLKKETAMLKGRESKRHDEDENNKQRFILYLKLFVVMGVNWSMELVSFAIEGPQYLWYITDICNTLQGVLIFLIFVWKDKIRRLLAKRFCSKLSRTAPSSRMRSTSSKSPSRSFSSTNLTLKTSSISSDIRLTPLVKRSESNGK
ncbi:unnamed protein product [Timema podura]|uniref:Uncharacterized protein n=1 Tax=Timema podura TaxID=61482 RepID=A0ABN7NVB8_TIMPD|nr:unnamed protein product [Timema podura]